MLASTVMSLLIVVSVFLSLLWITQTLVRRQMGQPSEGRED